MPALRTARLELRPVATEDLEQLWRLHSDPAAFAHDATQPLTDREQMAWVLSQWVDHWEQHGHGYLTVRAAPDTLPSGLLGVVGIGPVETPEGPGRPGGSALSAYWRLSPAVHGRGLAREAMEDVLADPRCTPTGREVLAITAAGNAPSLALAARLGFRRAPERPVPGGRDGDVLLVRPPS